MGLPKPINILSWDELQSSKTDIKKREIEQFITLYNTNKGKTVSDVLFGEEIELMMLDFHNNSDYKLLCNSTEVLESLPFCSYEYARYMIESIPEKPYSDENFMHEIEQGIVRRFNMINMRIQELHTTGFILPISVFPNLFADYFTSGSTDTKLTYQVTRSEVFPDIAVSQHPRFQAFTENVINRRARPIEGYIKVMKDRKTPPGDRIKIDSTGQGMGCCCLQVTIQCKSLDDARKLYDISAVLAPLLLRLTRSTAIGQGRLLSTETRWKMLEHSVDCRTEAEVLQIPKSRCSSVDLFLYNTVFNDIVVPLEMTSLKQLLDGGVEESIAKHVASQFIHDPLISYSSDATDATDFLNIQTSNWKSVRLKLPTKSGIDGWKVENRTMELQLTPFENTAYIVLVFLLSETLLKKEIDLYIPISKVDENFERANKFFRHKTEFTGKLCEDKQKFYCKKGEESITEGTLQEIFCDSIDGLLKLVYDHIDEKYSGCEKLRCYMNFIQGRCDGTYMSLSDYVRKFVFAHPLYKEDSVVCREILNDLISKLRLHHNENDPIYLLSDS